MSYNEGPSLDMATIKDFAPETTFVKDPNTFDLQGMYDSKFVGVYPSDNSAADDSNDFSLDDIKNKANEYSKKVMDMFGIDGEKEDVKPEVKPVNDNNKEESSSLADQVNKETSPDKLENNLSNKTNTKAIQNYMANPDSDLKSMLGDKKYNGSVDGVKNDELDSLLHYLEASIAKTIGNKEVFGIIANTYVGDVKNAVKNVVSYKKYLLKTKVGEMKLDDRFVELSKFLK